ncbi:PhoPQ-activated pathogenicity-related protein [Variovorax boronicumulans]|uniref:PhoPQ-activated protein PqaA family protein n=1 Tax=Variovorax boronicumulans TaxID=436515 RepID=UPI002787A859|nr:PhoPQ-activated protein PqaA family protein [Variovorax boronicumulans]MDP9919037.1 PhoPQ-activated pathogenicity-related protein [Variovorax boronicumulans]
MKRSNILIFLAALMLWCTGVASAGEVGPARFFNMKEILDERTLNAQIASDRVVPSRARPGRNVRVIELKFTSQNWQGMVWRHPARIYVPEGYKGGGNAGIIGTERNFFDDPQWHRQTIPGTQLRTEEQYAEATAVDLGLPIMMFSNPAEDFMGMDESDLMGYALKKVAETGDLGWYGYTAITRAYLRAITLMHSLPGVQTERAVIMGCSKRGMAVGIATGAGDDRVAGIMATCYYGGNNFYSLSKRFAEFGPNVRGPAKDRAGPGFQPAEKVLRSYNNPLGFALNTHFDPYMWRDKIKASYLVALGTNDEFFALGSSNSMIKEMSGDKAFLAVDNLPHSWVSQKHLAAWRMWLAHTFLQRPLPRIDAQGALDGERLRVSAKVETTTQLEGVRLFYAYNPIATDWRRAQWQSVSMTPGEGGYTAQLPRRSGQSIGYYVEVQDNGVGGAGYVSSLMESTD